MKQAHTLNTTYNIHRPTCSIATRYWDSDDGISWQKDRWRVNVDHNRDCYIQCAWTICSLIPSTWDLSKTKLECCRKSIHYLHSIHILEKVLYQTRFLALMVCWQNFICGCRFEGTLSAQSVVTWPSKTSFLFIAIFYFIRPFWLHFWHFYIPQPCTKELLQGQKCKIKANKKPHQKCWFIGLLK